MSLKERYKKEILKALQKELSIKNPMRVPKLKKIGINVGIGSLMQRQKDYSLVVENITKITGQKPVVVSSRVAISNFKLRKGMPVGVKVTLRKDKMYEFLDKFVNVVCPRIRDFRGVAKKGFDGKGNFSMGLKDCTVFPEISMDDLNKIHGLQISIETTAQDDKEGEALLSAFGFPFKKDNK